MNVKVTIVAFVEDPDVSEPDVIVRVGGVASGQHKGKCEVILLSIFVHLFYGWQT